MPQKAQAMQRIPTTNAANAVEKNNEVNMNRLTIINTLPLTKFGMVFAAVERMLVPNCSAAMVTNMAQYPVEAPNRKQKK